MVQASAIGSFDHITFDSIIVFPSSDKYDGNLHVLHGKLALIMALLLVGRCVCLVEDIRQ